MIDPIVIAREDFINGIMQLIEFDKKTLADQGHVASGKLRDSISSKIEFNGRDLIAHISAEDYGVPLSTGVPSQNVKYHPDQLKAWAKIVKPSLDDKEIESFLWAVWRKHKREGIPTEDSKRFSKTGRRIGWIKEGNDFAENQINQLFSIDKFLATLLDNSLSFIQQLNAA